MDHTERFRRLCVSQHTKDKGLLKAAAVKRKKPGDFKRQVDSILRELNNARTLFADHYDEYCNFGLYSSKISGKGLTEQERDKLDEQLTNFLSESGAETEKLRQQIGNMKAREGSFLEFKQVVVRCLVEIHAEISKSCGDLQLLRMKRLLASRPNLAKSNNLKVSLDKDFQSRYLLEETDEEEVDDISDEFKAELELENAALKEKLEKELSGAMQAEQQLSEFSQLLSMFNNKLSGQRETVQKIAQQAKISNVHVQKGNKELEKTDDRYTNDMQVFLAFLLASILLLIYDM